MTRNLRAAVAAAVLLLSGCGQDPTPAEQVPALSRALDRVDDAVAAERYDAARTALDELVNVAERAEARGDLDAAQADEVVTAAETLRDALPGEETEPAPTESSSPSSPTTSAPPEEDDGDEGKPEEKDEHPGKGKGKGHDKGKGDD
jgi:hypothetical protein